MTNDGGPAFPQGHMDGPHIDPSGMSLRDYFAGQALAGLVGAELSYEKLAEVCYRQADAFIEYRSQHDTQAIEAQQITLGLPRARQSLFGSFPSTPSTAAAPAKHHGFPHRLNAIVHGFVRCLGAAK